MQTEENLVTHADESQDENRHTKDDTEFDQIAREAGLDPAEIKTIYEQKELSKGNLWGQLLIVFLFFFYTQMEAFYFLEIGGMVNNIRSRLETSKESVYDNRQMKIQDYLQSNLIPMLYQYNNFTQQYEAALIGMAEQLDQMTAIDRLNLQMFQENKDWFMKLEDPDRVEHTKFFYSNYYVGTRISTIQAELESTFDTLFREVVPTKRTESNSDVINAKGRSRASATNILHHMSGQNVGGYWNDGVSIYLQGDMSLERANASLSHLREDGWWNETKHLCTAVEIMFYNEHIKIGIVLTYIFKQQNDGFIKMSDYTNIFLPQSYNMKKDEDLLKVNSVKLVIFCSVLLVYLYQFYQNAIRLNQKFYILIRHRINPFEIFDFMFTLQQVLYVTFLVYWSLLFLPQLTGKVEFTLPIRDEEQFSKWATSAMTLQKLRVVMGLCNIIHLLDTLTLTSFYLPSLGILFETLTKVKRDLLNVTFLAFLMLVATSAAGYLLFGYRMSNYMSVGDSLMSNFRMLFQEFDYDTMYLVNSSMSGLFCVAFVFLFIIFFLNLYTAIISETYIKLRHSKLLLSDAMLKIIIRNTLIKAKLWFNLLTCQRKSGERAQQEHNSLIVEMKLTWHEINKNEVQTKSQFIADLIETASMIRKKQEEAYENQFRGLSQILKQGQEQDSAFRIVKRNFYFIIYLIVTAIFFQSSTEVHKKHVSSAPIMSFLKNPQMSNENEPATIQKLDNIVKVLQIPSYMWNVTDQIANYEQSVGFNRPVGSTFCRISAHNQAFTVNNNIKTASVYPVTVPNELEEEFTKIETERMTYDLLVRSSFIGQWMFGKSNNDMVIENEFKIDGKKVPYIEPNQGDYKSSCMGQGGYIWEFDRQQNERQSGKSLKDLMTKLLDQIVQFKSFFTKFFLELYLYNPMSNLFTYAVVEFSLDLNGGITKNLFFYTDNSAWMFKWQKLAAFSVFALFTLIYLVVFLLKVRKHWMVFNEKEKKEREKIEDERNQNSDSRTNCSNLLLWIGIDTFQLEDYNIVQQMFICIFSVIRHVFRIFLKFFSAIHNECKGKLFEYLEIVVIILNINVLVSFIKLMSFFKSLEDPRQLQSASAMAYYHFDYNYWASIAIFVMVLRVLQIFQFSLVANLTVNTILSGYKQLANFLAIFMLLLFGEAQAAFLVFGSDLHAFGSIQVSIFSLVKILNGSFMYEQMASVAPVFTNCFFIYYMILHWIILLSLFISVIKGSVLEQIQIFEMLTKKQKDEMYQCESWSDGFFSVIFRVICLQWIGEHRRKQEQIRAKRILSGMMKKKQDDLKVEFYWGMGWKVPQSVVDFLNDWLDPDKSRFKENDDQQNEPIETYLPTEKEDKYVEPLSIEESEDLKEEEEDDEMFEVDYVPEEPLVHYLKHFENVFQVAKKFQDNKIRENDIWQEIDTEEFHKFSEKAIENFRCAGISEVLPFAINDTTTGAHFYKFHLEEQLLKMGKISSKSNFFSLRSFNSFFTSKLVSQPTTRTPFQIYVQNILENPKAKEREYDLLIEQMKRKPHEKTVVQMFQTRFDKSKAALPLNDKLKEMSLNYKFAAWTVMDQNHKEKTYNKLIKHKETKQTQTSNIKIIEEDDEEREKQKSEVTNEQALSLLSTKIMQSLENKKDLVSKSVLTSEVLTFNALACSDWRSPRLNMVHKDLRKIWISLTPEEQYDFWCNKFDTHERVRLWNGLVFQIDWFSQVVKRSKDKTSDFPLGPTRYDLEREIKRIITTIQANLPYEEAEYIKRKGEYSISLSEKNEVMHLAYGPMDQLKLWKVLYENDEIEIRANKPEPKPQTIETQPPDTARQLHAQVAEDDTQRVSTPETGSGGNKDSDEQIENKTERKRRRTTKEGFNEIDSNQRFAQVQYFFRNMVVFMKNECKDIFKDNLLESGEAPKRTLRQFEQLVKRMQQNFDRTESQARMTVHEERLQLWMLLSTREKLDMLFHQVVEHEAQIMCLLLESELGELGVDTTIEQLNAYDDQMEAALDQEIYRKYIGYTRLQAIRNSRKYFERKEQKALQYDENIIRYSSFLKSKYQTDERQIEDLQFLLQDSQEELAQIKRVVQDIANQEAESPNRVTEAKQTSYSKMDFPEETISIAKLLVDCARRVHNRANIHQESKKQR